MAAFSFSVQWERRYIYDTWSNVSCRAALFAWSSCPDFLKQASTYRKCSFCLKHYEVLRTQRNSASVYREMSNNKHCLHQKLAVGFCPTEQLCKIASKRIRSTIYSPTWRNVKLINHHSKFFRTFCAIMEEWPQFQWLITTRRLRIRHRILRIAQRAFVPVSHRKSRWYNSEQFNRHQWPCCAGKDVETILNGSHKRSLENGSTLKSTSVTIFCSEAGNLQM